MSASDFSGWRPSEAIVAEFERIRGNSTRIKAFVARYGERSALIFARALSPSFQSEREFRERRAVPGRDAGLEEARSIVRAVGRDAAALLPQLVRGYYHPQRIDRYA